MADPDPIETPLFVTPAQIAELEDYLYEHRDADLQHVLFARANKLMIKSVKKKKLKRLKNKIKRIRLFSVARKLVWSDYLKKRDHVLIQRTKIYDRWVLRKILMFLSRRRMVISDESELRIAKKAQDIYGYPSRTIYIPRSLYSNGNSNLYMNAEGAFHSADFWDDKLASDYEADEEEDKTEDSDHQGYSVEQPKRVDSSDDSTAASHK